MMDGAVLSVSANSVITVIEIQKMDSTNRRKSKSRKFVTATLAALAVANINQTSKFSKVRVASAGASTLAANLVRVSEPASLAGT